MGNEDLLLRIVLAVTLAAAGIAMVLVMRAAAQGRLRRNKVAGIRLRPTMTSEETWQVAHRAAQRPSRWAAGFLIAASATTVLPISMPVVEVIVLLAVIPVLGLLLHAANLAVKAARAHDRQSGRGGPTLTQLYLDD